MRRRRAGAEGLAHAGTLLLALLLLAAPARAQMSALPPGIGQAIAALGPVVDPAATAAILAPVLPPFPRPGVWEILDQAYGADPRQRLDVYVPEASGPPRGVVVFVHGGGFVGGNKANLRNIGAWAAEAGMIGVVITYRLAPAHPWPAAVEDLRDALGWVRAHAASFGANPDRIILAGHSAGAAHAAAYVAHPSFHVVPGGGVRGLILVSGLYDIARLAPSPGIAAYYGTDPEALAARSSLAGLAASSLPVMQATAALDPRQFLQQGDLLQAALCARPVGCAPALARLAGQNHISTIYGIGSADRELADAMAAFARRVP